MLCVSFIYYRNFGKVFVFVNNVNNKKYAVKTMDFTNSKLWKEIEILKTLVECPYVVSMIGNGCCGTHAFS